MRFPDARILIFAKAPLAGYAKTRLIPHLGEQGTAALAAELIHRTVRRIAAARLAPIELWCAPDRRHPLFAELSRGDPLTLHRQCDGDLGARMHHALQDATRRGGRAKILLGCDVPAMESAAVADAILALEGATDAVLGPVEDGGYWLIGLNRPDPRLFEGVAWSTPGVAEETRRRLRQQGLGWKELPLAWDLDDGDDLRRYQRLRESAGPEYARGRPAGG